MADAVDRALSRDPNERFPTVAEFGAALQGASASIDPGSPADRLPPVAERAQSAIRTASVTPEPQPPQTRNLALLLILMLIVVASLVTGVLLKQRPSRPRTTPPIEPERRQMVDSAAREARHWLELLDQGKIDEAWARSSNVVHTQYKRERFRELLTRSRHMLGRVVSRMRRRGEYRKTATSLPDGDYVEIEFATVFTQKKSTLEKLLCGRDATGTWRVISYNLR